MTQDAEDPELAGISPVMCRLLKAAEGARSRDLLLALSGMVLGVAVMVPSDRAVILQMLQSDMNMIREMGLSSVDEASALLEAATDQVKLLAALNAPADGRGH